MTTRNDIERVLWKACDSFRGKIDSSRYNDDRKNMPSTWSSTAAMSAVWSVL